MMLGSASVSGSFAQLLQRYCQQQQLITPVDCALVQLSDRLPVDQLAQMLDQIQAQCPDTPALGLAIGESAHTSDAGVLGYLALSCETLWEVLLRFTRYNRLCYDANQMQIDFVGDDLHIMWGVETLKPPTVLDDVMLSALVQFIRLIVGKQNIQLSRVQLIHPQHTKLQPYTDFYGCPVDMGQDKTCIQLPASLLTLKFQHADIQQISRLEQQAEALLSALPAVDDFDADMRNALITCLHNGEPNLEQIAYTLNLSVRSLQRRLSEQQQTFQQVLAKTRQHLAVQYLKDLSLSLNDISFLLGYSEQSAFQRAFKQWTQKTPQQVRQQLTTLSITDRLA